MNTWVVSTLWLLCVMLLWTLMCHRFVWVDVFAFLLGLDLGSRMAGSDSDTVYLSEEPQDSFPKQLPQFTFPPVLCEGSSMFTFFPALAVFLIEDHPCPCEGSAPSLWFWPAFPSWLQASPVAQMVESAQKIWVRQIPWSKERQPTPAFLPGEFHGQRSLAGYSPCYHRESDMAKATNAFLPD